MLIYVGRSNSDSDECKKFDGKIDEKTCNDALKTISKGCDTKTRTEKYGGIFDTSACDGKYRVRKNPR